MSIIDTRTLSSGHEIEADLCIIGSGAAGITLASEWLGKTARVAVLESGGLELDEELQQLNEGQVVGLPYAKLSETWLRMLGGTTNHWTALVGPLEENVFAPRSWIPHSGWPITRADLDPFYDRTRNFLKLPEDAFDVRHWTRIVRASGPWQFRENSVATRMTHWLKRTSRPLGKIWRPALEKNENVRIYLNATVLEIAPDPSAQHIEQLKVGTLDGKRFTARAKYYVLAGGGIENPRILLLSRSVQREGLGNRHDLVGRFFSNHRGARWATIQPSRPGVDPSFYLPRGHGAGAAHPILSLSEELQARHQLPNLRFNITIRGRRSAYRKRARRRREYGFEPAVAALEKSDFDRIIAQVVADVDSLTPGASESNPPKPFLLGAICESPPNRENRVRLGQPLDRLGQPRVVLDWRVAQDEEAAIGKGFLILGAQLGLSGIGRLQIPEGGLSFHNHSYHHMGTTRMHNDPKQGVVDANCRVHGIDNLFVAGSSVFPSYGAAEPTFTIIALAFRLSDHLERLIHAV